MNIYFVKRAIAVILYPKSGRTKELVVLDQLYITNGMDLFAPFDDLIGSVRVNVFD